MNKEDTTQEYKDFLLSLEEKPLNLFLEEFKLLESYKERELYLNKFFNKEIFNILFDEEFIKIYYLEPQAKFILKELSLNDFDILKTLVYCYNDNSREFNKELQEERLKEKLLKEGFKEQLVFSLNEEENKKIEDELKCLDGLNVKCVFDIDKIGLLGSYTEKGEYEGKLLFNGRICFLPKRHTKTGQILRSKFYYKVLK